MSTMSVIIVCQRGYPQKNYIKIVCDSAVKCFHLFEFILLSTFSPLGKHYRLLKHKLVPKLQLQLRIQLHAT